MYCHVGLWDDLDGRNMRGTQGGVFEYQGTALGIKRKALGSGGLAMGRSWMGVRLQNYYCLYGRLERHYRHMGMLDGLRQ